MKKAAVLSILVAVVLLALGVIAEAQQPKKVHRIGSLCSRRFRWCSSSSTHFGRVYASLDTWRKNIVIECRYAEGNLDRLPGLRPSLCALRWM